MLYQQKDAFRGKWKMARVSETHVSGDGCVRSVTLQYKALGNDAGDANYFGKRYTEIQRPVQKVVVLIPVEGNDP